LKQVCSKNREIYRAFRLLCILIQHLLLANYCLGESSSAGLSELVLCFWYFLVVRLGSFDYGPFYFLCCDFHLVRVSRKQTSFDFDLPVYETLTWQIVLSGSLRRVPLGLLTGEGPGAVPVFHREVRSLRVLLVLLGSYCRVYSPHVFL
jgi:hypothetical protein